MSPKARSYLFTLNDPEFPPEQLPEWDNIRYVRWQLEKGELGTEHIQGFVQLYKQTRLAGLSKWLPRAHFEPKKFGKDEQFSNQDTRIGGPWERGSLVTRQERRTDLEKRKLESAEHPPSKVPCNPVSPDPIGVWIYGPTGVGKTMKAFNEYPSPYLKKQDDRWPGYMPWKHHNVIVDDVDTQSKDFGRLLVTWTSGFPFLARINNYMCEILPKKVVVTSLYHPDKFPWTDSTKDAIKRQFKIIHMENKV